MFKVETGKIYSILTIVHKYNEYVINIVIYNKFTMHIYLVVFYVGSAKEYDLRLKLM